MMPAGAFAASGPTRYGRSKARSRKSHAAPSDAFALAGAELVPGARLRAGPRPRNKTVSKKYFGTMSWG